MRFGRVAGQGGGHRLAQLVARAAAFEPDKIDDDAAAELAQSQLACDRPRRRQIGNERPALGRIRLRGSSIDIDQHRSRSLGDMDAAAAGQGEARRQRRREFCVEVDRPVLGGTMRALDRGKCATQLRHDSRIVDQDLFWVGRQP